MFAAINNHRVPNRRVIDSRVVQHPTLGRCEVSLVEVDAGFSSLGVRIVIEREGKPAIEQAVATEVEGQRLLAKLSAWEG